jgi:hypothetical protein
MATALVCPLCRGKFRWNVELNGYPENCQVCHAYIGHDRDDDDIVMPSIKSARTRIADETYRQLERSSEHRAEEAARMAGCSVADMSSLKIADIRDNAREGEMSAVPVVNDVTRHMDAMQRAGLSVGYQRGIIPPTGAASPVQGPGVNAGAEMRTRLNALHVGAGGTPSAMPLPKEITDNPGYRRRG